MKLAIAQMTSRTGDFAATAARMVEYSAKAAEQGADLLVFPKTVLCGAFPVAKPDREGFMLDLVDCLLHLADSLACPCLVPITTEIAGTTFNEAMLIQDGNISPLHMRSAFNYLSDEDAEGGPAPIEFQIAGARVAVAFTYDDLDDYCDFDFGVDVILFLSGYGFAVDDPDSGLGTTLADGRFVADARDTGAWIVAAGPLGCYDMQPFIGSSFVLAPWGELAAQAPSFEEALLVAQIDPRSEGPLANPLMPEVADYPLTTWGALTLGLKGACEQRGFDDVCLRVENTLPSLLLAVLAVDSLGPTHVFALTRDRGGLDGVDPTVGELVRKLRLPKENVRSMRVPDDASTFVAQSTAEVQLAQLADELHALSLSPITKTDLALQGLPAISAAELLPFGDLFVTRLAGLARMRNMISPVLPQGSIVVPDPCMGPAFDALPSAERRATLVDLVLCDYIEGSMSVSDIVHANGNPELVEEVLRRLHGSEGRRGRLGVCCMLVVSCRTLVEASGSADVVWHDRVRADDERMTPEAVQALARQMAGDSDFDLDDLDFDLDDGPDLGGEFPRPQSDANDMLGYLRDFSVGGAFGHIEGVDDGPDSGFIPLWGGPFSEN